MDFFELGAAMGMAKVAGLDKEAIFGLFKKKPKASLEMLFPGHDKALGLGTKTNRLGVTANRFIDPASGRLTTKKTVSLHTPQPVTA